MFSRLVAAAGLAGVLAGIPGAEAGIVRVDDLSVATKCAEEDNVYLALTARAGEPVGGLTIRAEHPPYLEPGLPDQMAPDFSDCNMSGNPSYGFAPLTVVAYDDGRTRLVSHRYGENWRPTSVPVRVGATVLDGPHLLQLIDLTGPLPIEMIVLYPSDGYWRAKPLPPTDRAETGYGTSFLVGPVVEKIRPIVELAEVTVDPAARRFDLVFVGGGRARLEIVANSRSANVIEVRFDPPLDAARPFAALRSMYVAGDNNDAARLGWRGAAPWPWLDRPLDPGRRLAVEAAAIRLGRIAPSRHNTSAPDTVVEGFRVQP